jgi:hypothetical protein
LTTGPTLALRYRAPPTVRRFMDDRSFVRCIEGPVGSGKSSGCVVHLVERALKQKPGPDGIRRTRAAVIRNTFKELRDTTRKTFETWVSRGFGKWIEQDFTFHLRLPKVESEILFRGLDHPDDKKKLLSLDLSFAYVNEAREIAEDVVDMLETRVGRYPNALQGGCSWSGIWMDSNPWHRGHYLHRRFYSRDAKMKVKYRLFKQPGGRSAWAENVQNLPPGYYERLAIGKDSEWIRIYIDGEEGISDQGSIYGLFVETLGNRGGLEPFTVPMDGLFTFWDLGKADSTAIWTARVGDRGMDFLDHYENHLKSLGHYFGYIRHLEKRGYRFVKHVIPHDAAQETLATELSVFDQFVKEFGADNIIVGPRMPVEDRIAATRWLLEQPGTRIHPRCSEVRESGDVDGLNALREYKFEYDETHKIYKKVPLHNWASHTADAFGYGALTAKIAEMVVAGPEVPKPEDNFRDPSELTLEQLFEDNEIGDVGRRF